MRFCNQQRDFKLLSLKGQFLGSQSYYPRFLRVPTVDNNVLVIAALWPRQSGFQGAKIPNSKGTAELRDQLGVDGDHLVYGWVRGH
jgi:hypothetical protein